MKRFKWLSIFHYIWGGYLLFMVLFMGASLYLGGLSRYTTNLRASLCVNEPFKGDACDSWIIVFSILMLVFLVSFTLFNLLAAWAYKLGKPNAFNWIAACLNLLSVPIGTVLGIYSLWKLSNYLKELQDKN